MLTAPKHRQELRTNLRKTDFVYLRKVKVYIYRESWQLENGEIDGCATFQHKRFRQQRTVMEIVLSLFLILHKDIKSNLLMRKNRNFFCFFICSFHLNCPTTEEQITDRQVLLGVTQKVSSYSWKNKRIVLLSRAILQIIILICLNSSNICQLFIFSDWLSR